MCLVILPGTLGARMSSRQYSLEAHQGVIAEGGFDLPPDHSFSYLVPDSLQLKPGQRVRAPLGGRATRVGVVVAFRQGDEAGLRPIQHVVDTAPIISAAGLALGRWVADESLSSWGSTLLALLPPPSRARRAEPVAPAPEPAQPVSPRSPELWTSADRDERLGAMLASESEAVLVIAPDTASAARWARRLDAARLDSGAGEAVRREAWFAAARGRARVVVGTRGALLPPLPPPPTPVLLEAHDPAHKPPGPPRLHSRDILMRRAALDGSRLVLLSGAPAVESWARVDEGAGRRLPDGGGAWPQIIAAGTRGILRNHPLTLPLTRAIEERS